MSKAKSKGQTAKPAPIAAAPVVTVKPADKLATPAADVPRKGWATLGTVAKEAKLN